MMQKQVGAQQAPENHLNDRELDYIVHGIANDVLRFQQ